MTWLLVLALVALYIALALRIACWLGGLLRDAEVALACTCAKGRVCGRCLAESEAIRVKPEGSA